MLAECAKHIRIQSHAVREEGRERELNIDGHKDTSISQLLCRTNPICRAKSGFSENGPGFWSHFIISPLVFPAPGKRRSPKGARGLSGQTDRGG